MSAREESDLPAGRLGGDDAEASLLRSLRGVGSIVAPTTLLTALLFYFGWVYTDAQSRYLGIDVSLLGFSTRDYLLRSLDPAFLPLLGLLVAALGFHWAHGAILRWVDRGLPAVFLMASVGAGAVLLAGSVLSALVRSDGGNNTITPLGVMLGIVVLSYSAWVGAARRRRAHDAEPAAGSPVRRVILLLLLAVTLFWEVSLYADARGHRAGEDVVAGLGCLPDAVAYSDHRLFLGGKGVTEEPLGDPGQPEGFRYHGLKLLLHANGGYFLLPSSWSRADARTIVLPDDAVQRLEFVRPC